MISHFAVSIWSSLLAAGDTNPTPSGALTSPPPEIDPNRVTPGVWGFLSFLFFVIVAVVLYVSLRKQLRRVDFDEDATPEDRSGSEAKAAREQ